MFNSKYGVARHIYINVPKAGSANHAVSADWTPAAGDVKISKDGGAAANVTNLPTAIAMGNSAIWDFSITATEMEAAQVNITVSDSATKAVDDTGFVIETYGNASAQHEFDLDTASVAQTGDNFARLGAPAGASIAADLVAIDNFVDGVESALATAQADLNTITGADGVTLATVQPSITFQPITITAGDAIANITFAGTGTADGLAFTRTGSGNPFDSEFAAQIQSEATDALNAYDPPTNTELNTALDALPTAAENATAVLTTQMTESYRATGAAPTLAQAQFETIGHLGESSIASTTKTVKKLDGATTAKTYTLNDATTPTAITEAT